MSKDAYIFEATSGPIYLANFPDSGGWIVLGRGRSFLQEIMNSPDWDVVKIEKKGLVNTSKGLLRKIHAYESTGAAFVFFEGKEGVSGLHLPALDENFMKALTRAALGILILFILYQIAFKKTFKKT